MSLFYLWNYILKSYSQYLLCCKLYITQVFKDFYYSCSNEASFYQETIHPFQNIKQNNFLTATFHYWFRPQIWVFEKSMNMICVFDDNGNGYFQTTPPTADNSKSQTKHKTRSWKHQRTNKMVRKNYTKI